MTGIRIMALIAAATLAATPFLPLVRVDGGFVSMWSASALGSLFVLVFALGSAACAVWEQPQGSPFLVALGLVAVAIGGGGRPDATLLNAGQLGPGLYLAGAAFVLAVLAGLAKSIVNRRSRA